MRQTEKPIYAEGWKERPPSAFRKSFRVMTNECRIDSTIGEISDIETFVLLECNKAQKALCVVYGMCPFGV